MSGTIKANYIQTFVTNVTRIFWALAAVSAWLFPPPARATSCYSDLGIVRDVDPMHLARQAQAVAKRLEELGAPLDRWELETLELCFQGPRNAVSMSAIQQILDAHCLISVSLSLEAEIKAAAGPARPYLPIGGWGRFLIKVDNLGRHATPLCVASPNALAAAEPADLDPDRWMRSDLWPEGRALSGERVDYLILSVQSREAGRREALFAFSTPLRPPQEPGPLSYNRTSILFSALSEAEINRRMLAHLLRHEHGKAYLAAPKRRGPPLAFVREGTCRGCHDLDPAAQKNAAHMEKEKGCLVCHRELAAQNPPDSKARCLVCGMENCRMGCTARVKIQSGEEAALMAGIPRWLFLAGTGAVLAISFVVIELLNRRARKEKKYWSWNLLSIPILAWLFRRSWLKPLAQIPMFLLFGFLIYAGFAGSQEVNLTPVLTWTIWWAGLVFLVLLLGKAWCFVCPWDFAATLAQGIGWLWGSKRPFTLGLKWPRPLRNIYLAIGLFILLTWLELGWQVTASPRATAVLALAMVALSVVPALMFERRSFCRHGCFVGRISGLYAMFSPVELRAGDPAACRSCATRDCYRGNASAPPCPTSLYLPAVQENTYCLLCGYCARSCPERNVAVSLRPFAADLTSFLRPRADEAVLAVVLLSLTTFHGLTMTPIWDAAEGFSVIGWIRERSGAGPLAAFTLGMAAILIAPVLFYWLLCWIIRKVAGDGAVSTRKLFLYFAYSLLPVALFYHLAHNSMHFFMEGQYLLPLVSDPLGGGSDLLGTAASRPGPLLAGNSLWLLQVGFVLTGHIFGLLVAYRAARRLYTEPFKATLALLPMTAGMVLLSWFSLWILHLDMKMRSTLM